MAMLTSDTHTQSTNVSSTNCHAGDMLRDKWKENRSIGRRETSNGQGVEELKRRGISGVHQKKDEDETIGDKKDRKLAKGDSEIADKKGR